MRTLVLKQVGEPLELQSRDELAPGDGEVVVKLRAAALNRRDFWITQGMYPGIKTPVVLGSDGAGTVAKLGSGVDADWESRQVIVNPGWNWGENPAAQADDFCILGMPVDGTFADEVRVPAEYLHEKPQHLSWHEAAALPLGGLTAYRAVFTQGQVAEGETVLVTGIGGGVATFALQFAVAAGAKVLVTSSSEEKIARAVELGAIAGYEYTEKDWAEKLQNDHGPVHLTIDSAGGEGYAHLIDLAAPGGRIVNYGATTGPPKKLDLFKVFWKQLRLIGSTMGSPSDFRAMLELVTSSGIKPVIDDVLPLAEGNESLSRMKNSPQFGKLVLEIDA